MQQSLATMYITVIREPRLGPSLAEPDTKELVCGLLLQALECHPVLMQRCKCYQVCALGSSFWARRSAWRQEISCEAIMFAMVKDKGLN